MKRRIAYELLGRLRLSDLLLAAGRGARALRLTVLAYHRVCHPDPADPWDPDIISAGPDAFRRQLAFMKRHFSPVGSADLIAWLEDGAELPPRPLIVTFDDGYLDNRTVAMPILQEAGLTADFFVCPWQIDGRRLFWWDRIAHCVKRTRRLRIELTGPVQLALDVRTPTEREVARRRLLAVVKREVALDIGAFVSALEQAADVTIDEAREAGDLLMTWDDVRELRRVGMGVGSHSYSHPVLPLLGEDDVRRQLADSKDKLEAELGEPVTTFAYPVGRLTQSVRSLVPEAGYELAYSYSSGVNAVPSLDPFDVRRLAVERHMSDAFFRTMLALPTPTQERPWPTT